MSKRKIEIPDECPFIRTCSRRVFKAHYDCMCDSKTWVDCEWIHPEDYAQYQKKPNEWREEETEGRVVEGVEE